MQRILPIIGIILALTLLSPFFCTDACATDQLDLSVGLKTLFLINPKISGTVTVAIIYDPASSESKTDAEAIKTLMDNGTGVPSGLLLSAQLVNLQDIAKRSDAVFFLATGIGKDGFDIAGRAAAAVHALSLSTDLSCVKANKCVLGIVSSPHVEIYLSQAAAEASHVSFAPAFLMLVQQI